MAVNPRLKGQETKVLIKVDGALQTQIDTIQSCEIEFEQTLLEEGYLGEVADRVDSVFNLMRLAITGHCTSAAYLALFDAIVARSQNRPGGVARIDVVTSMAFANGDFPTVALLDCYFEGLPLNVGGRAEFVSFDLNGKCSQYKLLGV
jgi:hypothetical protein